MNVNVIVVTMRREYIKKLDAMRSVLTLAFMNTKYIWLKVKIICRIGLMPLRTW